MTEPTERFYDRDQYVRTHAWNGYYCACGHDLSFNSTYAWGMHLLKTWEAQ